MSEKFSSYAAKKMAHGKAHLGFLVPSVHNYVLDANKKYANIFFSQREEILQQELENVKKQIAAKEAEMKNALALFYSQISALGDIRELLEHELQVMAELKQKLEPNKIKIIK
jgi:serine phosphatase RsbU (regulator of sigma subunit)